MRNKNSEGHNFSNDEIQKVWEKGRIIPGYDPAIFRRDHCGAWIKRDLYGISSENLSMGWEIDHIKPLAKNGIDEMSNLQPLQWENNREKSDHYPSWDCLVTIIGDKNIYTSPHKDLRLSDF